MNWEKLLCSDRIRQVEKNKYSADNRSEFEKDYHRIIGSASFRRLQDKTQVFPLDKSDFIRTRLTHSLEVSSIAKSLGQSVSNNLVSQGIITPEQGNAIEDILLCAGLLHDIGNPPFGHFGETVIRDWFKDNLASLRFKGKSLEDCLTDQQKADLYNFEGNAQSLRVVTRLHHLVDDNGMNLTKALLNTIIKYPVSSTSINKKAGDIRLKKMGYFYADEEIFKDITTSTGAMDLRHPLVFLLEAADDIAYCTADLEDGFKKGILSYSKLLKLLKDYNENIADKENIIYKNCLYAPKKLEQLLERAIYYKEPDPESYAIQNWVVSMQSILIRSAVESFTLHHDDILAGTYNEDLFAGTSAEALAKLLKNIAFIHIFQCDSILRLEIAADKILSFLLNEFVTAAIEFDTDIKMTEKKEKLMQLISPNYMRIYIKSSEGLSEEDKLYLRLILVTDSIAGMTDHYAKSLYQELNGIY